MADKKKKGPTAVKVTTTHYTCENCIYFRAGLIWNKCAHPTNSMPEHIGEGTMTTPTWCPER